MPRALRTLSAKLALVLFGVVAAALAIVYLAVVPQLESRLVDAKFRELRAAAPDVRRAVAQRPYPHVGVPELFAFRLSARVVIFRRLSADSLAPVVDSSGDLRAAQEVRDDPVARDAAETGLVTSGRVSRDGRELAEVAIPADAQTVVLLSAPLGDALANVQLVRRTLLVAGLAALGFAALAGYLAAWGLTRRLRRLETAAHRIAGGDFHVPVVDTGSDEVAELTRAFDGMRTRLAGLDRARREFIANASHELRTPLFSLGGFLELMDDEELDDETRREFVAEMAAQVERLTRLATDLLDLSRLDAGQLSVERIAIDLTAIARTAADEFRAVAEARDHQLAARLERPVGALGDEQRVLQIARILLENALRHTPAGTHVELETAADDGRATLSVRDDGPGIGATDREHLFERFYRGDGGRASGSGLGLAIAAELAVMMGGRMRVVSEPAHTVFWLELPPTDAPSFSRENSEDVLAASDGVR